MIENFEEFHRSKLIKKACSHTTSIIFVIKMMKSIRFGSGVECYSIHLWWSDNEKKKIPLKKFIIEICKQSLFTFVRWMWQKKSPVQIDWYLFRVTHGHSRAPFDHIILSKYRGRWCTGAHTYTYIACNGICCVYTLSIIVHSVGCSAFISVCHCLKFIIF